MKKTKRLYISHKFVVTCRIDCMWATDSYRYIKSKKPIGSKKEYIGSPAQKKTNKITKFLINAFL